ncbi:MAG TPA: FAD-dependent oxidoreductase [Acidimicrobiales bacterium]|nr:FAD-dependent oxidoreductase [Acidimicrobiales bacterium]
MPTETFVIVGASLAGAKAAETLRDEGFEGRVVLVGEESFRPYERPPLSKGYLRGEQGFEDAAVHPAGFYAERGIELLTGTPAAAVEAAERRVVLASGETLAYDRLLLATGAAPRRLAVPGADLAGVHYLRSVADADSLRQALASSPRLVVVGAGWIGAEVAASARQLGAEVTMVEVAGVPLERVLGPEVGAVFRDLHADHGVGLRLGVGVEALAGSGRVEEVRLTDGSRLAADAVVVGVGVGPRTELAEAAGLALEDGVATDERLRSSDPAIFAAGDVANAFHPRYGERIRLEHWSAALNQGPVAARNMLGQEVAYERTPFFFSDQYDLGMEYRGWARSFEQVVFRGDPASRQFVAFWMGHRRVLAAMNVNVWNVGEALEALVASPSPVDPKRLADPDLDLAELATPASG